MISLSSMPRTVAGKTTVSTHVLHVPALIMLDECEKLERATPINTVRSRNAAAGKTLRNPGGNAGRVGSAYGLWFSRLTVGSGAIAAAKPASPCSPLTISRAMETSIGDSSAKEKPMPRVEAGWATPSTGTCGIEDSLQDSKCFATTATLASIVSAIASILEKVQRLGASRRPQAGPKCPALAWSG